MLHHLPYLIVGVAIFGASVIGVIFSARIAEAQRPNRTALYRPTQGTFIGMFVVVGVVGLFFVIASIIS